VTRLTFEVWEESGGRQVTCCPKGAAGSWLVGRDARLLRTFEAESFFEAMTIHYRLMGWGEYKTDGIDDVARRPFTEDNLPKD
jgi:hypothetical protein